MKQISRFFAVFMVFCLAGSAVQPVQAINRSINLGGSAAIVITMAAIGGFVGYLQAEETKQATVPTPQKNPNSLRTKIEHFYNKHRTILYTIAGAAIGGACSGTGLYFVQLSNNRLDARDGIEQHAEVKRNRIRELYMANEMNRDERTAYDQTLNDLVYNTEADLKRATSQQQINQIRQAFEAESEAAFNTAVTQAQNRRAQEAQARQEQLAREQRLRQEQESRRQQEARRQEEMRAAREQERLREDQKRRAREQAQNSFDATGTKLINEIENARQKGEISQIDYLFIDAAISSHGFNNRYLVTEANILVMNKEFEDKINQLLSQAREKRQRQANLEAHTSFLSTEAKLRSKVCKAYENSTISIKDYYEIKEAIDSHGLQYRSMVNESNINHMNKHFEDLIDRLLNEAKLNKQENKRKEEKNKNKKRRHVKKAKAQERNQASWLR